MRKTLLFDLDGTLLNTLEDLRDSTNFALRTYGYPERSLEEVRRFVGNGLKMLLTRAVPQGSSEVEIERALACMKAHYCENYHNKTVPYPGIPELLQRLQQAGFRMAIVSNKADPAVQLIRTLYFDGIIDVAVGESPACSKKPAPDMVLAALQRLGRRCDLSRRLRGRSADCEEFRSPLRHGRLGLPHGGRAARSRGADDLSLAGGARQGAAGRQNPVKEAGLLPFIGG